MSDRVLVTGGAGFIGSHVAEIYLSEGWDVTVIDDLSTGLRENVPAGAEFVHSDINDREARDVVVRGGFAVLSHHAAQMDVRVSVNDPLLDARVNIAGLLNLVEGARAGGVGRVVFASSGGVVYGDGESLPHGEQNSKLPASPYGVSKLASEYYLAMYNRLYGLEVVSLRYANVYGPRQNPHGEAGVVAIFCDGCVHKRPLTIYGDGTQTRDYVFVADVARANFVASTGTTPRLISLDDVAFNVGTGVETSVVELAREVQAVAGVEIPVNHEDARAGELKRSAVNPTKLSSTWSWKPQVSLAEGLKMTYDWVASCS